MHGAAAHPFSPLCVFCSPGVTTWIPAAAALPATDTAKSEAAVMATGMTKADFTGALRLAIFDSPCGATPVGRASCAIQLCPPGVQGKPEETSLYAHAVLGIPM